MPSGCPFFFRNYHFLCAGLLHRKKRIIRFVILYCGKFGVIEFAKSGLFLTTSKKNFFNLVNNTIPVIVVSTSDTGFRGTAQCVDIFTLSSVRTPLSLVITCHRANSWQYHRLCAPLWFSKIPLVRTHGCDRPVPPPCRPTSSSAQAVRTDKAACPQMSSHQMCRLSPAQWNGKPACLSFSRTLIEASRRAGVSGRTWPVRLADLELQRETWGEGSGPDRSSPASRGCLAVGPHLRPWSCSLISQIQNNTFSPWD